MTAPRIRALIVDDEPLARARLRALLAKHADMQLVGECAEGGEAIAAIGRTHPEVVFLDIQMTETTGLDVATSLAAEPRPAVVFVTAHERYALEAFEVRALDYLLKPFEESRFTATLDRVGLDRANGDRPSEIHPSSSLPTWSAVAAQVSELYGRLAG